MINSVNNNKNVLLVDDDTSVTQMLSLLLTSRGYKVKIANTGGEALRQASPATDLILLDLVLPDQEGFEVCRKFKEKKNTAGIPIIILSARLFPGDIVEGLYLGADDYLTKPFEYEELVARMEAVMRRGAILKADKIAEEAEREIVSELKKIINEEKITPFFQPIFKVNPFGLLGVEALARPKTDTMLMNPELLFKAAVQFGFYEELEMLSWKKAAEHAEYRLTEGKLFLNCNPYVVECDKFLEVNSILKGRKIDPSHIVLEITERTAVKDFKVFYEHLRKYKKAGFRFAVDDVGSGFASLESIVETKPELVKIDRHIVTQLEKDPFKRSIVKFIVSFCKENNIICIAEGIETFEELKIVKELGVDAVQGYYLYRPTSQINIKDYSLVKKLI